MSSYKTKCAVVFDYGLFQELAVTLSKSFGKVLYHSPWKGPVVYADDSWGGKGVPGIERVDEWEDTIEEGDIWCFPDIYTSGRQLYLEEIGKRVWGSRRGEELEVRRDRSKRHFKKLGLPVSPYEDVKGLTELREYLKGHKNQWVKVNFFRGDCETFFSPKYSIIKPRIDALEVSLGAKAESISFVVEENLEDVVETGYDGYCVDGQFPKSAFAGIESKDKAYIIKFKKASDIPKEIMTFNEKIAPTLAKYHYRNFFSTEIRVGRDKVPYMIDLCARMGSPPGSIYLNMIENLADIIWNGSEGKLVDPVCKHKFGAELLLNSQWYDTHEQGVKFPEKLRDNVKLRNFFMSKGEYYCIPFKMGIVSPASVVATGDSMDEVIEKVKEYAGQVEGYDLEYEAGALDKAKEQITKLKEFGITL